MEAHNERPHQPSTEPGWTEAWLFDVVHGPDIALSIEFVLRPGLKTVGFHTSLLHPDYGFVSLVDEDAPIPNSPSLEVRSPGLWTDIGIQTPLDHVTVDLEAFAVALDEPEDVFKGAYGIRTALGFELEWETADQIRPGAAENSYEVPCIVHGELLVDSDTIEIDGWGWRSHRWGVPASADRTRLRGRNPAGEWIHEQAPEAELSYQVIGAAPAPDLARLAPARLEQHFARTDHGDLAWIRR